MLDTHKLVIAIIMFIIANLFFIIYDNNFAISERGKIKWKTNLIISTIMITLFLLLN